MTSKTSTGKQSKGSVSIRCSHDRLQLRFRYQGKRECLSLGLPDTANNRKLAEAKARQIEMDILSNNFDPSMDKYRQTAFLAAQPLSPLIPKLNHLWTKFVESKQSQCSQNTMDTMYAQYTRYIQKLPTHDLTQAGEIKDFALKTFPINSAKRLMIRLNACCKWAMQNGLIDGNPFNGMASDIKLPKSQKNEDGEINPFTAEERDSILNAIATDQFNPAHSAFKHSYYFPFVYFLFKTGCRSSEAVALTWKDISKDFSSISFERSIIDTAQGRQVREGLKTQEKRKFPCNYTLQEFLKSIKPATAKPTDLVFPGMKGGYLDPDAFRKYVWKRILEGLGIEYRKLYQTRHTFITLALEARLDAKDVAKLVGNSPEVIYRHYAGSNRNLSVPDF
jgi:integrase